MRRIIIAVGVVFAVILGSILILSFRTSPLDHLAGNWVLVHHKVEKVVHRPKVKRLKEKFTSGFIPHKCEQWMFDDRQGLCLTDTEGKQIKARWSLKSRGDLLEVKGIDGGIRDLIIERVDNQSMVLYYHSDLQIKGIIKMTLHKVS